MAQDGRTEETTAEVARIFLGMQIQCAQCHDHPYDRWKREQFHELAAFFPRIGVRPVQSATERSFEVFANDRPARRRGRTTTRTVPRPSTSCRTSKTRRRPARGCSRKFFLTERQAALRHVRRRAPRDARQVAHRQRVVRQGDRQSHVGRARRRRFLRADRRPGPRPHRPAPQTIELLADELPRERLRPEVAHRDDLRDRAYQRESRPRRAEGEGLPFAANVPQPLRADQLYNAVLSALDAERRARAQCAAAPAADTAAIAARGAPSTTPSGYDPSDPRDAIARHRFRRCWR